MTADTLAAEAQSTASNTADVVNPAGGLSPAVPPTPAAGSRAENPRTSPARKAVGKKTKSLELTLTVVGTADGEWRAELKQGTTVVARNLAVAAYRALRHHAKPRGGACPRHRAARLGGDW